MFQRLLAMIVRVALWLRYDIRVEGLEQLKGRKGLLFLPNHPSEMDPVLLAVRLWNRFAPHPVAIEDFYWKPGVHWVMKQAGVIPIPNMDLGHSPYIRVRVKQAMRRAAELLQQGHNVLLYPSGRIMRTNEERLLANSAVKKILVQAPDAQVVLVRTRGLLGSSFSYLAWKQRPPLEQAIRHAIKWLLLNGIFFMPRRRVTVTLELAPDDFPRDADKMAINRWLENWYNRPPLEELSLVSYAFWKDVHVEVAEEEETGYVHEVEISDDVREDVYDFLGDLAEMRPKEIEPDMELATALGLDSLKIADLVTWLEEQYGVMDADPSDFSTVRDLLIIAAGGVKEKREHEPPRAPEGWEESSRPPLIAPAADATIHAAFLETCARHGSRVAIGDNSSGVLTYRKLKLRTLLLADLIYEMPAERIGIMLPASVGGAVVIAATLLAGKTPVMINWTLGDANLEHVLEVSGIDTILTSGRFLDRLETLNYRLIQDLVLTLEDVAHQRLTLGRKLAALWRSLRGPKALLRHYGSDRATADDPCIILFTSGSEAAPKGVPLTHRNVIGNILGALETETIQPDDIHLSFLPPFHSFGFTVGVVVPLVTGLKCCYYPNPTESRRVATAVSLWRPTMLCGTPTFVRGILRAAQEGQLDALRLVICGAEKTPDALYDTVEDACGATLIEGYGITETGPILTLNRPGERAGVGRPLPNVQIAIVDVESREPVEQGTRGLILAHGPNVFGGYLQRDSSDAFVEHDGRRWYVTGDLGRLDEDGCLWLEGRLKRFVKIGGEMLSLPAMEAAITSKWPDEEEEPQSAIAAIEREGERPVMALFTSHADIDRDAANEVLREAGFSNLARVSYVETLDEIPQLGTGKTDYRSLRKRLEKHVQESES